LHSLSPIRRRPTAATRHSSDPRRSAPGRPGHDYGRRPWSTIGIERAANPFLLVDDFAASLDLKRTWVTFKASNGLK
jgi:hypothetical protein